MDGMAGAPFPENEAVRLLDLARYHILDTQAEEAFDRITRLAAQVLRVPVAVLNFVDENRQWGKAMVGLESSEAPREHSFCAWTILEDGPFVVHNAPADPRFRDNPMVTGAPHIHLYAGAPLTTPAGQRIGTLCVTDDQPRTLDAQDLQALQDLAALAMTELELRAHVHVLTGHLSGREAYEAELRQTLEHARTLEGVQELGDLPLFPRELAHQTAALLTGALSSDWAALLVLRGAEAHGEWLPVRLPPDLAGLAGHFQALGQAVTGGLAHLTAPAYLDPYAAHPAARPDATTAGVQAVAWVPMGAWDGQSFVLMTARVSAERRSGWRASDRALLDAAARSVRVAVQRQTTLRSLEQEARRDALTRLLNRRAFDEDLHAHASSGAVTLALIDLDGFKAINDTEGHGAGDVVLRLFGSALESQLEKGQAAYRLGGDEFVLLLPGTCSDDAVHGLVDVAVLAAQQGTVGRIGASVGVARQAPGEDVQATLARADARMYAAKRQRQARRRERLT